MTNQKISHILSLLTPDNQYQLFDFIFGEERLSRWHTGPIQDICRDLMQDGLSITDLLTQTCCIVLDNIPSLKEKAYYIIPRTPGMSIETNGIKKGKPKIFKINNGHMYDCQDLDKLPAHLIDYYSTSIILSLN